MTQVPHSAVAVPDPTPAPEPTPAPTPDPAPTLVPYEYSYLRVVPRVERGEFVNAGVILYCQKLDFLGCTTHLDPTRVQALDPTTDVDGVALLLAAVSSVCCGGPDAGPAGADALGRRFRWLIAPRSTVVQPGPVHTGMTADPAAALARLASGL